MGELDADDAFDILLDQVQFDEYLSQRGIGVREARRELMELASPLLGSRQEETSTLRRARKAGFRGRADVEELCDFVDRAARLPGRQKQVFYLTVVHGYSLNECAAHLGIARETVRVHLRELRRTMRRCTDVRQQ